MRINLRLTFAKAELEDQSGKSMPPATCGTSAAPAALVVRHIDPQGRLVDVQLGESPFPGGMVHDMAVTQRHLVLPLPPVKLRFDVEEHILVPKPGKTGELDA